MTYIVGAFGEQANAPQTTDNFRYISFLEGPLFRKFHLTSFVQAVTFPVCETFEGKGVRKCGDVLFLLSIFCETENHFIVNTLSNNLYVGLTLGTTRRPVAEVRICTKQSLYEVKETRSVLPVIRMR